MTLRDSPKATPPRKQEQQSRAGQSEILEHFENLIICIFTPNKESKSNIHNYKILAIQKTLGEKHP
jgi:hypothetical protein